jgi:hypothetical protein
VNGILIFIFIFIFICPPFRWVAASKINNISGSVIKSKIHGWLCFGNFIKKMYLYKHNTLCWVSYHHHSLDPAFREKEASELCVHILFLISQ